MMQYFLCQDSKDSLQILLLVRFDYEREIPIINQQYIYDTTRKNTNSQRYIKFKVQIHVFLVVRT